MPVVAATLRAMAKWLSKDPDAYLPDRPPYAPPYLERAREHALRRDGPPHARDWKQVAPPWRAGLFFGPLWLIAGYAAAFLAGQDATLDTLVLSLPIVFLGRSDALRWGGAAIHERRSTPTWTGHPFGAAPWLAVFLLHVACVFGIVGITALSTSDEATQRLAVLSAGFVAGGAGWLLDVLWGRSERKDGGLPPAKPSGVPWPSDD